MEIESSRIRTAASLYGDRTVAFDDLALSVEGRMAGQVRDLIVEVSAGRRIVLRGRTTTYHARRRVEQTVLDLLGASVDLIDEIDVT